MEGFVTNHLLQLYTSDEHLVGVVSSYVVCSLDADESVVVVVTPQRWCDLSARLTGLGMDVPGLIDGGRLRVLDAQATLDELVKGGGLPSRVVFNDLLAPVLRDARAASPSGRLGLYGEMVDLLWEKGDLGASDELEGIWNALLRAGRSTLLCSYRADVSDPRVQCASLARIARSHGRVRLEFPAQAHAAFERAVHEILSPGQAAMLRVVVEADFPASRVVEHAPELRLLWLRLNMPQTADRILVRARRYAEASPSRTLGW